MCIGAAFVLISCFASCWEPQESAFQKFGKGLAIWWLKYIVGFFSALFAAIGLVISFSAPAVGLRVLAGVLAFWLMIFLTSRWLREKNVLPFTPA
jgi:hypothetical protein